MNINASVVASGSTTTEALTCDNLKLLSKSSAKDNAAENKKRVDDWLTDLSPTYDDTTSLSQRNLSFEDNATRLSQRDLSLCQQIWQHINSALCCCKCGEDNQEDDADDAIVEDDSKGSLLAVELTSEKNSKSEHRTATPEETGGANFATNMDAICCSLETAIGSLKKDSAVDDVFFSWLCGQHGPLVTCCSVCSALMMHPDIRTKSAVSYHNQELFGAPLLGGILGVKTLDLNELKSLLEISPPSQLQEELMEIVQRAEALLGAIKEAVSNT